MSSLMHCFAATAGSIREKTKMNITRPPLNGYLSVIRFLSQENMSYNYWWKKVSPAYIHFNGIEYSATCSNQVIDWLLIHRLPRQPQAYIQSELAAWLLKKDEHFKFDEKNRLESIQQSSNSECFLDVHFVSTYNMYTNIEFPSM